MNKPLNVAKMMEDFDKLSKLLVDMTGEDGNISGQFTVKLKNGEEMELGLEQIHALETWLTGRADLDIDSVQLCSSFVTYWEGQDIEELQNEDVKSYCLRADLEGMRLTIDTESGKTWTKLYPDKNSPAWRAVALYLIAHFCDQLKHVMGRYAMAWEFKVNLADRGITFEPIDQKLN